MKDEFAQIRRCGRGFAAEGPGYYVWDENMSEVLRALSELRRGNLSLQPTQRMLLVRSAETSASTADNEALDA